jgi:hypothetical protein
MTQHCLPSLSSLAATDQSKLPKDNGGRLPAVGHDGLDQSNNNNRRRQMGGGTTWTALQSQKATCIGGGGSGMTTKVDCDAMRGLR